MTACQGLADTRSTLGYVNLLARIIAAVVLGVGTIFGAKHEDSLWSDPPNWVITAEAEEDDSGDPKA